LIRWDKSAEEPDISSRALKIGITCYPTVGGSGVLASALGEELVKRGHEIHFISYQRPFRLPADHPHIRFHPVNVSTYELFQYPDYTLPLSVRMAEVSRDFGLDILHVHYAVPHATAAILARQMLPAGQQPRVVTTLHGTDTTLLGRDADYGPAIRHALASSDAVTAVSHYLRKQTLDLFPINLPIDVIHNFFSPRPPRRSRRQVRSELGIGDEAMILHSSNLRSVKRIDLLLETVARIKPRDSFKLVILAGGDFSPYESEVARLGLSDRVIVRNKVTEIEEYLQAADLALYTSEMESFCLGILEAMCFACPSVATNIGGIPEVIENNVSGRLVTLGDVDAMAEAVNDLISSPSRRREMGQAARKQASELFSADAIVSQYEGVYRRVLESV
jgi:N-acetyl-alpha-D-glucosaminyl L-malate synthase BshA